MWIHRYIDMNPHLSQNILNKGIFRMWIHCYIDMYPHCLDNSNLVGECIHILLSIMECIQIAWASKVLYCLGRGIYGIRRNIRDNIYWIETSFNKLHLSPILLQRDCTQTQQNGCQISRRQHLVTLKGNQ